MSEAQSKRGLPGRTRMRHQAHFVEHLEARHGEPVGKCVPIESLDPDVDQPRSTMGDLDDLVASIRERGILEPILVRPRHDTTDADVGLPPFRIIAGERRYQAARLAGLVEVPIIEMDVDDTEALEIALIENLQRKDLTPFEEAQGYRALMDRMGLTQAEVGQRIGKTRTVVTEALALLAIPPRVQDAVQALGITSKTVLREIAKLDGEQAMIEVLEEVADRGLSRDDLRERARQQERPKNRRPGHAKPHVFRFKAPDKRYDLSLRFRTSTVERTDLISALEEILRDLRQAQEAES